ncbi:MAG TPA: cysteine desulfurase-like protein [Acidimicrobiia bacterium]|nr:cysteine desulfurase-like protein [Acidimicrobiia bacterium]
MSEVLDVEDVRSRFPALERTEQGRPVAYLDGPGGTQVPETVIEAMASTLRRGVSNLGGGFGASDEAVRITNESRQAIADLFNGDPTGVVFGQNMTSLTFAVSRALAATWSEGDSVVLTGLDHDANFTPWQRVAAERGIEVRVAEPDRETGELAPDAVTRLLDETVRLVAVPFASNALGNVVDVAAICAAARETGAISYVDAVHAGPHRLIDVAAVGADFVAASSYKFFGPHIGVLHGLPEHLATMDAYKVRPAPSDPPGKWETGTQSFESLAGVTAAVGHIASLGTGEGRSAIESGMARIGDHERELGRRFLEGIAGMRHVRLYGVPEMNEHRVATFAVAVDGMHPDHVAAVMAERGVYVWSGHYYAVNLMDRLGLLDGGGLVRIGFVHYNTAEEVDRVLEVLGSLAG